MPLFLWFFIVGGGLMSARALSDPTAPVYGRLDYNAHSDLGKPGVPGYYFQSSVPWIAVASPDLSGKNTCRVVLLAFVTSGKRTRLRVGGVEQLVDWSWSIDYTLNPGTRHTIPAVFLDPVGGKQLARRDLTVRCVTDPVPIRDQNLYDERGLRGYTPVCPVCPSS